MAHFGRAAGFRLWRAHHSQFLFLFLQMTVLWRPWSFLGNMSVDLVVVDRHVQLGRCSSAENRGNSLSFFCAGNCTVLLTKATVAGTLFGSFFK